MLQVRVQPLSDRLLLWMALEGMVGFPPSPLGSCDIPGIHCELSFIPWCILPSGYYVSTLEVRPGWAGEITCPKEARSHGKRRQLSSKKGLKKGKGWKKKMMACSARREHGVE